MGAPAQRGRSPVRGYVSSRHVDTRALKNVHLEDCVQRGCIEGHRMKYLNSWASTFSGTLRVHPPRAGQRTQNGDRFRMIHEFEFFLWSDLRTQPDFEYIKGRIARAVQVHPSGLRFETMSGEKLDYRSSVEHLPRTAHFRSPRQLDPAHIKLVSQLSAQAAAN